MSHLCLLIIAIAITYLTLQTFLGGDKANFKMAKIVGHGKWTSNKPAIVIAEKYNVIDVGLEYKSV